MFVYDDINYVILVSVTEEKVIFSSPVCSIILLIFQTCLLRVIMILFSSWLPAHTEVVVPVVVVNEWMCPVSHVCVCVCVCDDPWAHYIICVMVVIKCFRCLLLVVFHRNRAQKEKQSMVENKFEG